MEGGINVDDESRDADEIKETEAVNGSESEDGPGGVVFVCVLGGGMDVVGQCLWWGVCVCV